jgi:molybdopterin molybdotransferase
MSATQPVTLPSYEEAAAIVAARAAELARIATATEPATEVVQLGEAAGRVLAAAICADREMPPFPRSTRDGYAVRAEEANSGAALRVVGSIRAGDAPVQEPLASGTALEIMTGAAVPAWANAVAMLEHVQADAETGTETIRLLPPRKPLRRLEPGENIVPQGAEARAGDEIVPAGTRMTAAHLAAAAACGYAELAVFRKPRVAILATGDELVAVSATPAPGQIRNSNSPMLAALVEQAGGQPIVLARPVADTDEALDAALEKVGRADMILLSGGVSAGRFDLVEPALARRGARFHLTGARIQPGKPVVFGELEGGLRPRPFFGLPGNPISSAATFLLFAAPVLAALAGHTDSPPRFALARLKRAVKGNPNLTRFVPAVCDAASAEVAPAGSQGSGDVAAFARANCFLMVPEGTAEIPSGEIVKILPF